MAVTVYFGWRLAAKGEEEGRIVCHPPFQVTTEGTEGKTNLPRITRGGRGIRVAGVAECLEGLWTMEQVARG